MADVRAMDASKREASLSAEYAKPTRQRVELARLCSPDHWQPDARVVADYGAAMRNGDRFPPIDVVQLQDGRLVIMDGHHRTGAARINGELTIDALVFQCPADMDARAFMAWLEVELAPKDWLDHVAKLGTDAATTSGDE